MIKKNVFSFFILMLPLIASAQLVSLGKKRLSESVRITSTPTTGDYTISDPDYRYSYKLADGFPNEKAAWIVYSDRANNIAYQNASNKSQPIDSLTFMQPCFVIGEADDYLELAKYVPGINTGSKKSRLQSPSYIGWVNKNNLLLWNKAVKDTRSGAYLKMITAYGTERIFEILPGLVTQDSIITFSSPSLNTPAGTCGMENLFYLYKQSPDGNEYLVGPAPSFIPDNATKADLCWISKDLLRIWGTNGFVSLHSELPASIPFYANRPAVKNGVAETGPTALKQSPYPGSLSDMEQLYPIIKYTTTANGNAIVYSGFLEEVLDNGNAKLRNMSGTMIDAADIDQFRMKSSRLNIMLVVAGGGDNSQYIGNLQSILTASDWQNKARSLFNTINVGAVIYGSYAAGCSDEVTPLSPDIKETDAFFTDYLNANGNACNSNVYSQALYRGINVAATMLKEHKGESNVIVVYGAGADNMGNIGAAIEGITNTMSRLLIFQTHNKGGGQTYSDFVGAAKDLITRSAKNITVLKKDRIVPNTYPNLITDDVAFATDTATPAKYLDYPARSIVQGYVVFPEANDNMQPVYLQSSLDALIASIAQDNRRIDNAYQTAVAHSGSSNTKIRNSFQYRFPSYLSQLPASFIKANTLRSQPFLIPAWAVLTGSTINDQRGLVSGVLLNTTEYRDFTNRLEALGDGPSGTKEAIVKHIKDVVAKTEKDRSISLNSDISDMTFSEIMGFVTGYYPTDAVWMAATLSEFQSNKKISVEVGRSFIRESKNKATWLRDHNNSPDIRIRNNSMDYYLVYQDHLPINTFIATATQTGKQTATKQVNKLPLHTPAVNSQSIGNATGSSTATPAAATGKSVKLSGFNEAVNTMSKGRATNTEATANNSNSAVTTAAHTDNESQRDTADKAEQSKATHTSETTTNHDEKGKVDLEHDLNKPGATNAETAASYSSPAKMNNIPTTDVKDLQQDLGKFEHDKNRKVIEKQADSIDRVIVDYRQQLNKKTKADTAHSPATANKSYDNVPKQTVSEEKNSVNYGAMLDKMDQYDTLKQTGSPASTPVNDNNNDTYLKEINTNQPSKSTNYNNILSDLDKMGTGVRKDEDIEKQDKDRKKEKRKKRKSSD